jgi:hypothetical protein
MVVASASISGAATQQQQPCAPGNALTAMGHFFQGVGNAGSPANRAQHDFEQAACEYRACFASNQNNANACEGQRHIMDASAQAAGHYNGSR